MAAQRNIVEFLIKERDDHELCLLKKSSKIIRLMESEKWVELSEELPSFTKELQAFMISEETLGKYIEKSNVN